MQWIKPGLPLCQTAAVITVLLWLISGDAAVGECDFKAPTIKQIKKNDTVLKCDQSIEVSHF